METKPNQTQKVDEYMTKFEHPLKNVVEELRQIIIKIDKEIGEEVKWNAPAFFYSGPMEPSDPKLYKRYLAVTNVHYKDYIMMVLLNGSDLDDGSGFLEGEYNDGRRIVKFYSLKNVKDKKKKLVEVIKQLLDKVKG